jgi:hypothetical protein
MSASEIERDNQTAHERRERVIAELLEKANISTNTLAAKHRRIGPSIARATRRSNPSPWLFLVGITVWGAAVIVVLVSLLHGVL